MGVTNDGTVMCLLWASRPLAIPPDRRDAAQAVLASIPGMCATCYVVLRTPMIPRLLQAAQVRTHGHKRHYAGVMRCPRAGASLATPPGGESWLSHALTFVGRTWHLSVWSPCPSLALPPLFGEERLVKIARPEAGIEIG